MKSHSSKFPFLLGNSNVRLLGKARTSKRTERLKFAEKIAVNVVGTRELYRGEESRIELHSTM